MHFAIERLPLLPRNVSLPISSVIHNLAASHDDASSIDALLPQFLSFFPIRHGSKIKRGSGDWRSISQFHFLSDGEILQCLKGESELQRACRFDTKTRFAAIQIPAGSCYYEVDELSRVSGALGSIAPNIKLFQYAEDRYLYIFFTEPLHSADVSIALSECLTKAGFKISTSTISVYPTDDALPLPLQPGFAWLNAAGQIIVRREDVTLESAISLFLFDCHKNAINPTFFFSAIAEAAAEHGHALLTSTVSDSEILPECTGDHTSPESAAFDQNEKPRVEEHKARSLDENLIQLTNPLSPALGCSGRDTLSEKKRAPPSNIRKYVTPKCRSPDSRDWARDSFSIDQHKSFKQPRSRNQSGMNDTRKED